MNVDFYRKGWPPLTKALPPPPKPPPPPKVSLSTPLLNNERIDELERSLDAALKKIAELERLVADKEQDLESWRNSAQYEE